MISTSICLFFTISLIVASNSGLMHGVSDHGVGHCTSKIAFLEQEQRNSSYITAFKDCDVPINSFSTRVLIVFQDLGD